MKYKARGPLCHRLSQQGIPDFKQGIYGQAWEGEVGKADRLQIPLENLQVKAGCLSEINQNPQSVHFRQGNLKKNMQLLFLVELSRICVS